MKLAVAAAALAMFASSALAEVIPREMRGETIRITGQGPPRVPPQPKKQYHRIAPPYSDAAILQDKWAKAWLMLDIDENGVVDRLKLLKAPGYDLDQIAIERGFAMRFEPAEDGNGHRVRSQLILPIEWPSYWWLVRFEGLTTKVPSYVSRVPCAGSGPLHLGSVHPTYRDCSPLPAQEAIDTAPWIARR